MRVCQSDSVFALSPKHTDTRRRAFFLVSACERKPSIRFRLLSPTADGGRQRVLFIAVGPDAFVLTTQLYVC